MELFVQLLDREAQSDSHWWYNLGAMSGVHVGLYVRRDTSRELLMGAFRERIANLLTQGLSEPFLIRHLWNDLDDWVRGRADTSRWDAHADRIKATMQDVIDDPSARARWREQMARQSPEWANKSDDELVADARRTIADSPITRRTTAEDAAQKWAELAEWEELSSDLLPPEIYDHWTRLNIAAEQA